MTVIIIITVSIALIRIFLRSNINTFGGCPIIKVIRIRIRADLTLTVNWSSKRVSCYMQISATTIVVQL